MRSLRNAAFSIRIPLCYPYCSRKVRLTAFAFQPSSAAISDAAWREVRLHIVPIKRNKTQHNVGMALVQEEKKQEYILHDSSLNSSRSIDGSSPLTKTWSIFGETGSLRGSGGPFGVVTIDIAALHVGNCVKNVAITRI